MIGSNSRSLSDINVKSLLTTKVGCKNIEVSYRRFSDSVNVSNNNHNRPSKDFPSQDHLKWYFEQGSVPTFKPTPNNFKTNDHL